ncbi:hypothetical protein BGX28_003226 [Mortierella sp. GBA30]|nr:hypothetical protein BGX28_003226 [Mortierella sp. GBA30]
MSAFLRTLTGRGPGSRLPRIPPSTRLPSVAFSTSTPASYAIEKKALSKKITVPKDPYLLSEKVLKFARNGKLDDAVTLVLEAPKSRQNEVVWNHLIQESSKLGKTSQSWKLLNDMKKRGFEPNDRTYTILLNALAINSSSPNNVSRAKILYQQMQDSEDTAPTLAHTNALLKVCARSNDHDTLLSIYRTMPKSGPNAPDVVTFNVLINSLARMGGDKGFEQAWKIWEDCLAAKTQRPDQVDLDQALVDAMLLACREARSSNFVKRGLRLIESLYGLTLSSSSSSLTLGKALDEMTATEKAISPSKGLGLGAFLRKDTIQPRTVELLLSICSKLKEYKKAAQYMALIQHTFPDFKADSQLVSSLMHIQIMNKQYEEALNAWDELNKLELPHTPATFQQGLDAALKARNWEKTVEMHSEMRSLIGQNKDIDITRHRPINPIVRQQDAWSLLSVIKCAVKTKHLQEGLQILRESRWTRVVGSPQYPRANADLAALAIKIYKNALKPVKGESNSQADVLRLERELQEAEKLQIRLEAELARHDERKAEKETEGRGRSRGQWTSVARSSVSNDDESANEYNMEQGYSKQEPRAPKSSNGGERRKKRFDWNEHNNIAHNERLRSPARQSQLRTSGNSQGTRSWQRRDRFESAFRPTKTFRRNVYDESS